MKKFLIWGGISLVVVLVVCACASFALNGAPPQIELPVTGPEVWTLSGQDYSVFGTSFLTTDDNTTLFLGKVKCDFVPDDSHIDQAEKLAYHMVKNGYDKKMAQPKRNGEILAPSGKVAIAFIKPKGDANGKDIGYIYTFVIEDLMKKE